MELQFQVKNQRLYLNTVNQVVADSKNYLTATFTFTDDWDGATKVAQFTRGTTTTNVTISNGSCTVPQAVLAGEGEFFVSVYGSINNEATIITANAVKVAVLPSGFVANAGTISQEDAAALQAHADAVTAVVNSSSESVGGYAKEIVFTVRGQSMYLTSRGKVVADSQGYLGAKFLFSEDWADTIKIAQFKRDDLFFSIILNSDGTCTIPWEVLVDEGTFIVSVFGNNRPNDENKIITVNPVEVHVEKSGLTDGELPSNPTYGIDGSTLYEIMVYADRAEAAASTATTAKNQAQEYASSASDSADSASASAVAASASATSASNSATAAANSATAAANAQQVVENYASGFAPLTSPAFDGIPTAPTAMVGTDTDQIATTAFVQAELEDYATLNDLDDYVELTSSGYIKSASVSGNTLTLTKGNDATVQFTATNPTKVSDLTNDAGYITGVDWDDIDDKPTDFPPSTHNHDETYLKLSGGTLTGTTYATTQSANDNSTKLATTAYADTAAANAAASLASTASEVLDTLADLSAALGDDPDFASTMATQLASKANASDLNNYLPLSGGTMTGSIMFTGLNDRSAGIDLNNDGKNFDIGWNYNNRDGGGFYLRSTDFSTTTGGGFGAYARNETNSYDLFGNPNGSLTWNGTSFSVGGGTGSLNGIATSANALNNLYTASTRPASANTTYADGKVRTYLATSTMTTGKPPSDAHILHLAWDNGKYDGQIALSTSNGNLYWRTQDNSDTWGAWQTAAKSGHTHNYAGSSSAGGAATSASKLATARAVDGVNFDGSAGIVHYGTCSTAAATAAKTVSCTSFTLVTGSRIIVKFTVTNTAANPTLNVNSTGAKAIQYRGAAIGAGNLAENRTYEFVYDGTNYQLVGDINTNTTYSAGTAALIEAGSDTANRVWQAKILADYITSASTTGTASNVTGTVAIANGGTGATTRLNALKALTNESVSTNAQYFLTITSSWGKGGYTSVADAKTVLGLGSAAYTASTAYATSSHSHSNFVKSGSTAAAGFVPAPSTTAGTTKYLREDCTWQVPPNTNNAVTKTKITFPASATNYYLVADSEDATATGGLSKFGTNARLQVTAGTTSAEGKAEIILGNATEAGTAGNVNGAITFYNNKGKYSIIKPHSGDTANRTLYTPKSDGTLVVHTTDTAIGSASKPVYVTAAGVATACTYTLEKSVPSNAVFTDTHWTSHLYVGSGTAANAATTNGNTKIVNTDNSTVRNTITIKGTNATTVTSDANGVITINSVNTNNISATGTNYIRFNNNRQICWGSVDINAGYNHKTVTFPAAFSATPSFVYDVRGGTGGYSSLSATSVYLSNGEDGVTITWIAVGSWS